MILKNCIFIKFSKSLIDFRRSITGDQLLFHSTLPFYLPGGINMIFFSLKSSRSNTVVIPLVHHNARSPTFEFPDIPSE